MRIGIDCRIITTPEQGGAGVPHYILHVVRQLIAQHNEHDYVLFFDRKSALWEAFSQPHVECVLIPGARFRRFLPLFYSQILYALALRRARLDIFHATNTGIPLFYNGVSVSTVHDLGVYRAGSFFGWGHRLGTRLIFPHSLRRARAVIAVSQAVQKDIEQVFPHTVKKIRVIYEGAPRAWEPLGDGATGEVLKKFQVKKGNFFVFIGTIEPRKNLVRLVGAFERLLDMYKGRTTQPVLLLAGNTGWQSEPTLKAVCNSRWGEYIRYVGYISDTEKQALLRCARAFVFPSLWEGFGLGNLEAMRVGTPVMTSRLPVLEEIVNDAALLVDPLDQGALTQALQNLYEDDALCDRLRARGSKRLQRFSWEKCVEQTVKLYEDFGKF